MAQVERRGAVRVPARLAMEVTVGGEAAAVKSLNVNANGVYFATAKYMPVLTKLRVTLELADKDDRHSNRVACEGVVVRSEPEFEDPSVSEYSVACYFTSVSDADRETLEAYILRHIPF